jgi:hypothetical protein
MIVLIVVLVAFEIWLVNKALSYYFACIGLRYYLMFCYADEITNSDMKKLIHKGIKLKFHLEKL